MLSFLKRTAKTFVLATLPEKSATALRTRVMRYRVAHYRRRLVEHAYGKHRLRMWIADPVGADWYDHDWEPLAELTLLAKHRLRPGARVLDVGAHQGLIALLLAQEVGPKGQVIAVEASPFNAGLARENARANRADAVTVLHCAAAEAPGELVMNEDSNGQIVKEGSGIRVPARTIDSISAEFGYPDVLLLDIEGFECQALRGAHETLRHRPDCFIEVHVGLGLETFGGSVSALVAFFEPNTTFYVRGPDEPGFRPIPRAELLKGEHPVLQRRFFLVATTDAR